MATTGDQIIAVCEAEWDAWKADCSGFVKAVATKIGVPLSGRANQIIDHLESAAGWENLATDGPLATTRASQGCLVVAGLKAQPHGHVVVIVQSASQKFPLAYWGRLGTVGRKNTSINWSWNRADLPKVRYFAIVP
jgi:hypothetical protein